MSHGQDILDDLGDEGACSSPSFRQSNQANQLCNAIHSLSLSGQSDAPARRALEVPEEIQRRMDFNRPEFFHRRSLDGRSMDSQRGTDSPVRTSFDSNGRRSCDSHSMRSLDPEDFPDYASYLAARVCTIKRSMDPSSANGQDVLDEIYEIQDLEFEEEVIEDVEPEDFSDFSAFRERYNTMLERAKYNYEMGKSNIHLQ